MTFAANGYRCSLRKSNLTPCHSEARSIGDTAALRIDNSLEMFKLHHYAATALQQTALSPLLGFGLNVRFSQGLRPGLYSGTASRLMELAES